MMWSEAKKIIESDAEVAKELEANEKEFNLINEFIKARIEQNLPQTREKKTVKTR